MITTHQRQMIVLSRAKQVLNLVNCGASLSDAVYEIFPDYHERQDFLFILKNFKACGTIDDLVEHVSNKKDMPSAGVYFW